MKADKKIQSLYKAILFLRDEKECRRFFRDLLTEAEIKEFAARWRVAQMLEDKVDYETITKETGMSSTTIARINKWLNSGMGGYKLMLKRINKTNKKINANHHHSPFVAE